MNVVPLITMKAELFMTENELAPIAMATVFSNGQMEQNMKDNEKIIKLMAMGNSGTLMAISMRDNEKRIKQMDTVCTHIYNDSKCSDIYKLAIILPF